MLNKIKNSKRGQIFAYLDVISIIVLVIIIVGLLIYLNISNNKEKKNVELLTEGINLPHYLMNIFQSEVIEMPNCNVLNINSTRIDVLVWLNHQKVNSEENYYKDCVGDFSKSLLLVNKNLGNVDIVFDFILEDMLIYEAGFDLIDALRKDFFRRVIVDYDKPQNGIDSFVSIPFKDKFLLYELGYNNIKYFEINIPAKSPTGEDVEEIKILVFYKPIEE